MTKRLILIRHGISIWNHEFRYQGHTDIELSPEGVTQAQALQKRLAPEKLEAIYSSDLQRAWNTAQIIAEPHGLEVVMLPELREINFGVWEGLTYQDLERDYPELLKIWLEKPHDLQVPGGESFPMVKERSLQIIYQILAKHQETVVVVTHGGTIAAIICGLLQQPLAKMWDYKHNNTALTVLTREDEKFKLEVLNDTSHLTLKEF